MAETGVKFTYQADSEPDSSKAQLCGMAVRDLADAWRAAPPESVDWKELYRAACARIAALEADVAAMRSAVHYLADLVGAGWKHPVIAAIKAEAAAARGRR